MPRYPSVFSRAALAVLAAALLGAGCASVDLGPRYSPPPVRMPQPLPAEPAPVPSGATTQPVAPEQPIGQPLPPFGQVGPGAMAQQPAPPAPPAPPDAQANLVTLTTRLEPAAVVPPARSSASGQLDALYDSSTRVLRWKASWNGLSTPISGVQFHGPADTSQNGPATMVWPAPFGPSYEGRAALTPQQAADLLDGRWYVSVRTLAFPAGELRGQLRVVK